MKLAKYLFSALASVFAVAVGNHWWFAKICLHSGGVLSEIGYGCMRSNGYEPARVVELGVWVLNVYVLVVLFFVVSWCIGKVTALSGPKT
ncbi:hypothetical protein PVT68_05385 [Microbulbifer bruguierae]|uniref:Uncharacterized protein n=1 Tax=Microbulbifer bruguierae TaxID=3029061 RepID=A0ABY8NFZ7_9GAMM|nr:hypothetical protein [Microbulbifer bruguierae]WGL17728.1 hypothetical protein PVT68_05385 [Microbulbifer bruguierae]